MRDLTLKYTYDEVADAVFLYLVDQIDFGEVKRSSMVDLYVPGASMCVDLDATGRALGIEFLGVSNLFTAETIEGLRLGRTPFPSDGGE